MRAPHGAGAGDPEPAAAAARRSDGAAQYSRRRSVGRRPVLDRKRLARGLDDAVWRIVLVWCVALGFLDDRAKPLGLRSVLLAAFSS